jgi:hypothetical protein
MQDFLTPIVWQYDADFSKTALYLPNIIPAFVLLYSELLSTYGNDDTARSIFQMGTGFKFTFSVLHGSKFMVERAR